jgi:hypothetical protein
MTDGWFMEAIGAMTRPSKSSEARRKRRRNKTGVEVMVARYAAKQDIWTGAYLQGEDAEDWYRWSIGQMSKTAEQDEEVLGEAA